MKLDFDKFFNSIWYGIFLAAYFVVILIVGYMCV